MQKYKTDRYELNANIFNISCLTIKSLDKKNLHLFILYIYCYQKPVLVKNSKNYKKKNSAKNVCTKYLLIF